LALFIQVTTSVSDMAHVLTEDFSQQSQRTTKNGTKSSDSYN